MTLALDDERGDRELACSSCGDPYRLVTGFVYRDGNAAALYHAQCHGHDGVSEVWLDVVVDDPHQPEFSGQFTFSCRVSIDGAGLVDAPVAGSGQGDYFGTKVSRREALDHERGDEVWEIVDFVVTTDPTVSAYIYGSDA